MVWSEFRAFALKGNVLDLAVGVIIGGAFGKIVSSLINDILMPIIGLLLGGLNFLSLQITVGHAVIKYGSFIQNVVDFFIVAFSIFLLIKGLRRFRRKDEPKKPDEPKHTKAEELLSDIRDLLRERISDQ